MKNTISNIIDAPWRIRLKRFENFKVAPSSTISCRRVKGFSNQSHFRIGPHSVCNAALAYDRPQATISIGKRCFIGRSLLVAAKRIDIGDDVMVSWNVTIVDHDSHSVDYAMRFQDVADWSQGKKNWEVVPQADVTISNKVWIGFNASVLKGVTIGEGAVVAAGSMVVKDVPAWSVVAGNPAKVAKHLGEQDAR